MNLLITNDTKHKVRMQGSMWAVTFEMDVSIYVEARKINQTECVPLALITEVYAGQRHLLILQYNSQISFPSLSINRKRSLLIFRYSSLFFPHTGRQLVSLLGCLATHKHTHPLCDSVDSYCKNSVSHSFKN